MTFQESLKSIALEAGNLFARHHVTRIDTKEGHANFVTNLDQAVQDYLSDALTRLLPGSRIIGEEKENDRLTDEPTWIVDPVDGTTNLIHDTRCSAVSIALCRNRIPVAGLVFQPYSKELFYAEAGKGAFLNDQPIHVSDYPMDRALAAFGTSPYHAELAEQSMTLALELLRRCADIRRSGSAAMDLAYVACGRLDVFCELSLKPWDYAAGSLLVTEAGGSFAMPLLEGSPRFDQTTAILAANPLCAGPALDLLRNAV